MDKSTIEYINKINKSREERNEIQRELVKKVKSIRYLDDKVKNDLISRISVEFYNNEKKEKASNVFSELSEQNKKNIQKKEELTSELIKIKWDIQKQKRRYSSLKKILINEDFSGNDEYTINKKKKKRDNTKVKLEKIESTIESLKTKKDEIESEISEIEIIENKKKQHTTRTSLERNETNFKNYSIEELLEYDTGISEELKDKIIRAIRISINNSKHINAFNQKKAKKICSRIIRIIIFAFLMKILTINIENKEDVFLIMSCIVGVIAYIAFTKFANSKRIKSRIIIFIAISTLLIILFSDLYLSNSK